MRRLFLMFCFVVPTLCCAQKEATHWYFGDSLGIRFVDGGPEILHDGKTTITVGGSAVMSDRTTGELLFYTDGETVWNRNHDVMANGFDLAGNSGIGQNALIVPFPDSERHYYIFTTENTEKAEFRYSVVDMNEENGLGAVVEKNIFLQDSARGQAATIHCNGEEYWVITHHMRRNTFYAFHVTKTGISPFPVVSSAGAIATGGNPAISPYLVAHLEISPNSKMVTVETRTFFPKASTVLLQLFDFNNAIGVVSNARVIKEDPSFRLDPNNGVTFSPDNTKLYLLGMRDPILYQYDVTIPDANSIRASEFVLFDDRHFNSTEGLQIGPDGKIYVDMIGRLGIIHNPNAKGLAADFEVNGLVWDSLETLSLTTLPNFIDSWFNEGKDGRDCASPISAFDADTVLCLGDSLHVRDRSIRLPDSWIWTFEGGDPERFEGQDPPPVWYPASGAYTVTLETTNAFGSHRDSLAITVAPLPDVDAGPDVTICRGEQAALEARGADSYQWTPAATLSDDAIANPTAAPEETTQYIVTGTNVFGCIARDTVIVRVVESVEAIVGGDMATCAGQSLRLQASGGAEYRWTPSTYLDDPQSPTPLLTPPADAVDETITYTVEVSSGVCASTASVNVRIHALPPADAGPDTAVCAGQTIRLQASGGAEYLWTPSTYLDDPQSPTPLLTPPANAVDETIIYTVEVSSGVCASTASVNVRIHAPPTVDAGPDTTICPGAPTQLSGSGNGTFLWTPIDGLDDPTSPTPIAAPSETTVYRLTVTGVGGCTAFDETTVTVESALDLSVRTPEPICAGDSVQLFADGAGAYRWEPAQFFRDPTEQNPWVAPAENQIFTVRGSDRGCEGVATVEVMVFPAPNVAAGPDTTICAGAVATLHASGGESYAWTPTDGLSDPRSAQPEAHPAQTTAYTVTVTDAHGCSAAASMQVAVLPHAAITLEVENIDAAAFPNELRSLNVFVRATPDALVQAAIDALDLTLAYDVEGLGYEDMGILSGASAAGWNWQAQERPEDGALIVRGSGPPLAAAGPLFSVSFRVFLARHRDLFSDIEIIAAQAGGAGACYDVTPEPGGITLSPFCMSDNRAIDLTGASFGLKALRPNPATERAELHYSVGFAVHARITVYSALGERVRTIVDGFKSAGQYSATIDGLPSGSYYCVMESGPYRATRPLFILR